MRRILPAVLLLMAASLLVYAGDEPIVGPSKATVGSQVSVTMRFKVKAPPATKNFILTALVPRSIPGRQKVLLIRYSQEPVQVFEKGGDRYAQFVFNETPENLEVAINVDAEVYRYDYVTASENQVARQFARKDALKQWLVHETYLEKDAPEVQDAARGLAGSTEKETMRNCFQFVLKTLKGRPFDDKDYGAVWALREKKGDCTEFADLFVTLCRAQGIPARVCEGYVLEDPVDTPKHNWAEVYSKKYGWVPIDPYHAYNNRAKSFTQLRPIYLLLDVQRRNQTLHNYHFYAYTYQTPGPVQVRDEFRVNSRKDLGVK